MPAKSFSQTLNDAIRDISEHGFDSANRVETWMRALKDAAEATMTARRTMEKMLRDALVAIYKRLIERGGVIRYHPGLERFTLENIKPALRAELDRRIMASAELIKLNREASIQKTLQRFAGWSTSIPKGGSDAVKKKKEKETIRRSIAGLPFEERKVLVDQGHKLIASINDIIATDQGAIAAEWRSTFEANYNFREEHRARNGKIFVVKGNWAMAKGLMKLAGTKYTDDITAPGEEVFCFPGETKLQLFNDVEKAYRRWYDGPIIELTLASGGVLRATPNHPIMTANGWIAAGFLNEGDRVFEISDEGIKSSVLNTDETIPTFTEFFQSVGQVGFREKPRLGVSMDFHGDGTAGQNVDIISITRPLRLSRTSMLAQAFNHFRLTLSDFLFSSIGVIDELMVSPLSPSRSGVHLGDSASVVSIVNGPASRAYSIGNSVNIGVEGDGKLISAFTGLISALQFVATKIAPMNEAWTKIDESLLVPQPDSHDADIDGFGNFLNRPSVSAELVDVLNVKRDHFAGHVFNLQTKSGWYGANRIIVSNCRCRYRYIYNLRDLPRDMLTEKGRDALKIARREARADSNGYFSDGWLIDRSHDVKWMAVASKHGGKAYVDRTVPHQYINNGRLLDPARPLAEHEAAELERIEELLDEFWEAHNRAPNEDEKEKIYLAAHYGAANPAERRWLEDHGFSWQEHESWCRGELSRLEHRTIVKPPLDAHVRASRHDRRELVEAIDDPR